MHILMYIFKFAGPSGLEACVIICLPKLVVLCFNGGPFGSKLYPPFIVLEHLSDHWALHRSIWLDFFDPPNQIDFFIVR